MNKSRNHFILFIVLFAAVVLLNEFFIPNNPYVPEIGLLYFSLKVLISDHSLVISFLETFSVIYLELFILFFVFSFLINSVKVVSLIKKVNDGVSKLKFLFPAFLWLLMIMWIPNSFLVNTIFIGILMIMDSMSELSKDWHLFHSKKIIPLIHLVRSSEKSKGVKNIEQPVINLYTKKSILTNIGLNHKKYLMVLIVTELLSHNYDSIGNLYYLAIDYWNVSYGIVLITLTSLSFYIMDRVIRLIVSKQIGSKYIEK